MDNKFTNEEKALIQEYAYSTAPKRTFFYVMMVLTPIAAEVYGIMEKDIPAMIIGFLSLLALLIWVLTSSWGDAKLLTSICTKFMNK